MKNVYKKTYELIMRSKEGAFLYLMTCAVGVALYMLVTIALGLPNAYDTSALFKENLWKALVSVLPGIVLIAWFSAGIIGIFTKQALGLMPREITYYANHWFLRKIIIQILFICIFSFAFIFFFIPHTIILAIIWLIAAIWISLRLSLWLNASVDRDLCLGESLKRSFSLTRGYAFRLLILFGVPALIISLFGQLFEKAISGHGMAILFSKSIFQGLTQIIVMAICAAVYAEIKQKTEQLPKEIPEEKPAVEAKE